MAWLFLIALLLAWPTFGISLLVWLAIMWMQAQKKAIKSEERKEKALIIEPLFGGRYVDFYKKLSPPLKDGSHAIDEKDAHQCTRHIVNYIAHNSEELKIFIEGLERWPKEGGGLCDPVTALDLEVSLGRRGNIHEVSLRAIAALMKQNPQLKCFQNVDSHRLQPKIARFKHS